VSWYLWGKTLKFLNVELGGWGLAFSYGNVSFKAVDAAGAPVSVASPKNSVAANHCKSCHSSNISAKIGVKIL
jgi:hypothetical protein